MIRSSRVSSTMAVNSVFSRTQNWMFVLLPLVTKWRIKKIVLNRVALSSVFPICASIFSSYNMKPCNRNNFSTVRSRLLSFTIFLSLTFHQKFRRNAKRELDKGQRQMLATTTSQNNWERPRKKGKRQRRYFSLKARDSVCVENFHTSKRRKRKSGFTLSKKSEVSAFLSLCSRRNFSLKLFVVRGGKHSLNLSNVAIKVSSHINTSNCSY